MTWLFIAVALSGFAIGAAAYAILRGRLPMNWRFESLPWWAEAWLEEVGVPMNFRMVDLTPDHKRHLGAFGMAVCLWEMGLLYVTCTEGEGVKTTLSKKGMEMVSFLEKLEAGA